MRTTVGNSMEYTAMRQIFCLLILIMACSGFGHAQTQDWTGVPQPGNDPQLQQLYAQAVAQANQTYAAAQQYMPNTAGVGAQYTAWVKESTILFDAKWDYWQLLNPHGAMTNNPQYMKDWAAYQSQCFPQCPNFANSGSANAGGKSTNPTAPINTINQSLYGAAALSRGLVSPTAEAQQEADAEATALLAQIQAGGGGSAAANQTATDDPLDYSGPRELDFNSPETLPDTLPGVSVITFPAAGASGSSIAVPCLTVLTCTPVDSALVPPTSNQLSEATPALKSDQPGTNSQTLSQPSDDSDTTRNQSLLSKIGNALVPSAEADTSTSGGGALSSTGNGLQPAGLISQAPGASATSPSAVANITSQVADQTTQPSAEAQQYLNSVGQVAVAVTKDVETGLPSTLIGALDDNRATALYKTSFGGASVSVANIMDPQPAPTDPISAGITFLQNQFAAAITSKAYDLTTAVAVNAAISANPDQRDEIAFRAYIVPNLFTPAQIVKGFKSFWGIVVDGKQAGEQ